jgi:tRNA A37 threonylcarbamoyladenosine dehydratase
VSPRPLSRSADLTRLRDEGYEISLRGDFLVVSHVPYVTAARTVAYGTLVSTLNFAGDTTTTPETHVMNFAGEVPCDADGNRLDSLINLEQTQEQVSGVTTSFMFSSKPASGQYPDYYAKVSTYVAILEHQAQRIDPSATARSYAPTVDDDEDSVFLYADTASSRAGIRTISAKLEIRRVALVGLGGTGAYVLDLLAKTPIKEIHLFDGDRFHQHNAFRSPGAATWDELATNPFKVDYLASRYSPMRRQIVAHPVHVTPQNLHELDGMQFVFLSVDDGPAKRTIVTHLETRGIDFIDVGMGLYTADDRLGGIVRTTLSRNHPSSRSAARARISFADETGNEYRSNIQIADLNALNAAAAVIAFKKHLGFYLDLDPADTSTFTVDTGASDRDSTA